MKTKLSLLSVLIFTSQFAQAETFDDFFNQTKVDGYVRMYDFNKNYGDYNQPSQQGFNLGGALNILTGPLLLQGLQAGATYYSAQGLGINSNNPEHVDKTLPGYTVNTLGQLYLQYQRNNLLLRAGNQLIDTPWLNSADARIIPATYQGFFASYSWQDLTFSALRTFRYKSRTANNFTRSNLYNPGNYGGTTITDYGNTATNGAAALGASYKKNNLDVNAWYYKFYDLANLIYGDSTYTFNTYHTQPFISAQALREWGDGSNLLAPYEGGSANANAVGLMAGADFNRVDLSLAYNNLFQRSGTFKNGDIISPYTSGYNSDPLYTTSMMGGLVEKSSGQAVKFTSSYLTENKAWKFSASYAKYFTTPQYANSTEVDFDAGYEFTGRLHGLSLRDRVGIQNGVQSTGRVLQNRIMMQYKF